MRIAVDAMGGDRAPESIVEGALLAVRELGVQVLLVGDQAVIEPLLDRMDGVPRGSVEIVHASEHIAMDEKSPSEAVRTRKDNSLSVAAHEVRKGNAAAMITAGHTGAAMTAATFGLGRIRGVARPALLIPFPSLKGPTAWLDVGANAEVKPEHLLQFAVMGAAYAQHILGRERPRVGLLTIGEERGKGNQLVQQTYPLLEASHLNFVGNIEGMDVPLGVVDVAVTDGFTGNLMLKMAEGISELVRETLSEEARRDPLSSLGGLLMTPALRRVRKRWDYRQFGGAMLLGTRGEVSIGHGRSDAQAVVSMIDVARRGAAHGLVDAITEDIARSAETIAEVAAESAEGDASEPAKGS
jgi:glycerol-3-phosphate acyltransferase PlsX